MQTLQYWTAKPSACVYNMIYVILNMWHICILICIYIYDICVYIYIWHMCIYMYIYIYKCMYVCMYVYIYIYSYRIYIYTCICIFIACICIYIYKHHTHICVCIYLYDIPYMFGSARHFSRSRQSWLCVRPACRNTTNAKAMTTILRCLTSFHF